MLLLLQGCGFDGQRSAMLVCKRLATFAPFESRVSRNKVASLWPGRRAIHLARYSFLLMLCTGCHQARTHREIALIPLYSTDMLSLCAHAGMDEAAAGHGLSIRFNGPSDGETQQQIDLVAQAIHAGARGIALMPPRLYPVNGVIRQAVAKGIPVVVLLHPVPLPALAHLSFVIEDLQREAALIAARVHQFPEPHRTAIIVADETVGAGTRSRIAAVEAALRTAVPTLPILHVIAQSADSSGFLASLAKAVGEAPRSEVIIALDSNACIVTATMLHHLPKVQRTGTRLICFDQSAETLAALRQGDVDTLLAQDMRTMGQIAVRNIERDRDHGTVAAVTEVPPLLLTRASVDSAQAQHLLLLNWVPQ